jgi:hypothetical protein
MIDFHAPSPASTKLIMLTKPSKGISEALRTSIVKKRCREVGLAIDAPGEIQWTRWYKVDTTRQKGFDDL